VTFEVLAAVRLMIRVILIKILETGKENADSVNPLNAELNPICHLLALLGGATIVVVSRLRVNIA
jgi:hypothetical protein